MKNLKIESLSEFIAIILLYGEIEKFENGQTLMKKARKTMTRLAANLVTGKKTERDVFEGLFIDENPYFKLMKKHIEEVENYAEKN